MSFREGVKPSFDILPTMSKKFSSGRMTDLYAGFVFFGLSYLSFDTLSEVIKSKGYHWHKSSIQHE